MKLEDTLLSAAQAWCIADAVRQELLSRDKAGVLAIVSSHGRLILKYAMDGITPYNAHLCEQKARQAASIGRRTRFIRDKVLDPDHPYSPRFLDIDPQEFVPWAGGVPILNDRGAVLGGIGLCIATEDEDEEIAVLAVESAGFISDR